MIKKIPQEQKQAIIGQIQRYFQVERGEELGDLAAETMFEFMLQTLGPLVYNEALMDARKIMNERLLSLEDELYTLEKPMKLLLR
jgi:uncharacterized protein (DUF2164 family)